MALRIIERNVKRFLHVETDAMHRRRDLFMHAVRQRFADHDLFSRNANVHHFPSDLPRSPRVTEPVCPKKARTIGRDPTTVNLPLLRGVGDFHLAQTAPFNRRGDSQRFTIFCDRPTSDVDAVCA